MHRSGSLRCPPFVFAQRDNVCIECQRFGFRCRRYVSWTLWSGIRCGAVSAVQRLTRQASFAENPALARVIRTPEDYERLVPWTACTPARARLGATGVRSADHGPRAAAPTVATLKCYTGSFIHTENMCVYVLPKGDAEETMRYGDNNDDDE